MNRGTIYEFASLCIHEQNVLAEQVMQTIVKSLRTMLINSEIDLKLKQNCSCQQPLWTDCCQILSKLHHWVYVWLPALIVTKWEKWISWQIFSEKNDKKANCDRTITRENWSRYTRSSWKNSRYVVLAHPRLKVCEIMEAKAYHMTQWFQFWMFIWAWKSFLKDGCHGCSKLSIKEVVWQLQKVFDVDVIIWTNSCAIS